MDAQRLQSGRYGRMCAWEAGVVDRAGELEVDQGWERYREPREQAVLEGSPQLVMVRNVQGYVENAEMLRGDRVEDRQDETPYVRAWRELEHVIAITTTKENDDVLIE